MWPRSSTIDCHRNCHSYFITEWELLQTGVMGLRNNLLGLPAIRQLQLLPEVNTVQKSIPDQYPELFTGLGSIKESYKIKMKPDAKPYALFTPRHVPLPLRTKWVSSPHHGVLE